MQRPMRILYVYYGTYGIAGAYIHQLAKAFSTLTCQVYMAVSAYYEFATLYSNVALLKCFFPVTELVPENPYLRFAFLRRLRKPIRYVEQFISYMKLLVFVLVMRIDVVNLSLIDDRIATFLFFVGLKLLRVKTIVTAHDIQPFGKPALPIMRRFIFSLANKVLVHNEQSHEQLAKTFGIRLSNVQIHVFPLSDYGSILDLKKYDHYLNEINTRLNRYTRVFLFIGTIRQEKGLDILIDQWIKHMGYCSESVLVIAGYPAIDVSDMHLRSAQCANILWDLRRLDDEEFVAYMDASHVIVTPYRDYAHSSIYLAAYLHSRRCVIASDNALFKTFIDDTNGFMFCLDDVESLGATLRQVRNLSALELQQRADNGRQRLLQTLELLSKQLGELYQVPFRVA